MANENREPDYWFSLKGGKRIPVFKGDSKEDIKNRVAEATGKKSNTTSKTSKTPVNSFDAQKMKKDIAENKSTAEKLNNESKYRDELAKGDKVTMSNGRMMFKGKEVDKIDTSEAGNAGEQSFADHLDKNGNLTPERAEVHRQILESYFKDHKPYAPGDEKVAMFTGGGAASGKGVFSKNIGDFYSQNKNPMIIDPDEVKKMLAKADGKTMDERLTAYYHEESSALAKQIYGTALQNNYPTLYDGTATGGGVYKLLDAAKKAGYKTEMSFVYSDFKTVRQNSLDRFVKQKRLVPLHQLTAAHRKAYDAVQKLSGVVDSLKVYDNAGRNLRLTAEGGKGKNLNVKDNASWKRFSESSGEFTLNEKQIDDYMQDVLKLKKQYNI